MDKKQFAQIAAALGAAYGDRKYMQSNEDIELWFGMLKDLDYNSCRNAVQQLIATSKFHPSIAEIREKSVSITALPIAGWGEAWGAVLYAIRRFGMYREMEALEGLDELTRKCVESLGYQNLCLSENTETDRANFRMIYQEMAKCEREKRQIPEAVKRSQLEMMREAIGIEEQIYEPSGAPALDGR